MFTLDPQLEKDTWPVASLPLCQLLLAKNAAWPWFILVPKRENKVELIDLTEVEQGELWREIAQVSRIVQQLFVPDKLNVAAIGNVVRQLHVHIVARRMGDSNWPAPIWGSAFSATYTEDQRQEIVTRIYDALHH